MSFSRPDRSNRGQREAARRSHQTPEQSLLWTVTIALFAAGAVMVYSASSASSALTTHGDPMGYLKRYLVLGALGLLAMRYTSRIDLNHLRRLTPLLVGASFALLLLVLLPGIGVQVNGARRWIGPGIARFQPSELMKFALVLYVAMLVAKDPRRVRNLKSMSNPLFYVVGAAMLLIALQPDLGTDLVICGTIGMILVAAGARIKDLAKIGAVLVALVLVFT
ncbi:MAG: FtsW/RodA/SpoVE family cell cycle protein, partial [Thermoleophilia bacterium]|nr:FtsW/RodA/SpoVE family cell cycle protein [Thermoleophilia bacterium]